MNSKQQAFVTEYLRLGDKLMAYQNAYSAHGAAHRTIESAANRLLNTPEVAKAILAVQYRIRNEVETELKEQLRTELLTVQRKRELLEQIATGNIWIEQHDKGKDCNTCTRLVRPTINQMLKAIDLDSKLAGHYTNKKQVTVVHTTEPTSTRHPENTGSFPVVREGGLRQRSKTEGSELKSPISSQNTSHPELDSGSHETQTQQKIEKTQTRDNRHTKKHGMLPSPTGEGPGVRSFITRSELQQLFSTPLQPKKQLQPISEKPVFKK